MPTIKVETFGLLAAGRTFPSVTTAGQKQGTKAPTTPVDFKLLWNGI